MTFASPRFLLGLVLLATTPAAARPVAFRDAGGPVDSVRDGETGLLVGGPVDGGTAPEFTAALRRLLVEQPLRERMGARAREWAGRFRWEDTVLAWERVLEEEAGR